MKKYKIMIFAAVLILFSALAGCTSPAELLSYRSEDAEFTVDVTDGDLVYSARITLESGKPALLTFLSPEEAEGISLYADGGVAYIGNGVGIPFSEKESGAVFGLLRVVSSLPEDVKTVITTEFNGEKVYRCETADGAVFVTGEGDPTGFSAGNLTATVKR